MLQVIKRIYYYLMLMLSFISRAFRNRKLTMNLAIQAYKSQGVIFLGYPRFIRKLPKLAY